MSESGVSIGRETVYLRDIKVCLKENHRNETDFVLIPLFHPRHRRDSFGVSCNRDTPATRSDRELECKDWTSSVVGRISPWIDLDSDVQHIQRSSEVSLKQELAWAAHLCLQAIVLPTPRLHAPNYSRSLAQLCSLNGYQQMWMRIPLIAPMQHHSVSESVEETHNKDGWQIWDNFRHYCGHTHRVCVALELNLEPGEQSELGADLFLQRWAAEPVKAVLLDTKLFVTNKAGYPVLSKYLQRILEFFFDFKAKIILTGTAHHQIPLSPTVGGSTAEFLPYSQYLRHLKNKHHNSSGSLHPSERFYRDVLQAPLQPLMDNLEAQTYETFERDPVKYMRYEAAITAALMDIQAAAAGSSVSDESEPMISSESTAPLPTAATVAPPSPIVVTVVGAGRGPLVAAVLSAASLANVSVRVYAVEKNQNAVITLRNRVKTEMWSNVTVVDRDMRRWNPTELCDLMVSELLGSFGDNELSPECLDGAQKCLKPGGISIPQSYTSYIAPMASAKLWKAASEMLDGKGLGTPFVVKLHSYFQCAEAKPLFRFEHPTAVPEHLIDYTRFERVSFECPVAMTLHGVAGYFDSVLYKDVTLSIVPATHTPGMFSWFPLFIPLCVPLQVKAGETITMNIWRCCDASRVWYEWNTSQPSVTPVQNSNGRCYHIGL